jgi:amino acid adenylation domain-containing protein
VTAVPVSAAQRQFWLAEQLRTREHGVLDATYSTAEVLVIDGGIDAAVLESAIRMLPQRHDVLRMSFETIDGEPHAAMLSDAPISLVRKQVAGRQEFEQLLALDRPFALGEPPLWRAVVGTNGAVTYLALVLHHIVADGWSVELLVRDLGALYRALAEGKPLPAPPLRAYQSYAEDHSRRLGAGELDESTAHWRDVLASAPELSTVPGLGPSAHHGGAQYFHALPAGRHQDVCAAAARMRATPYAVYLSAYILALARLTGQCDVVVGMPSANRLDETFLDVVGPFATVLPIRIAIPDATRPDGLVARVAEKVFEAMAHQEVPLAEIASGHRQPRAGKPLFQTVAMQRLWRDEHTTFADLPARRLWMSTGTAKYDLVVSFPDNGNDERIVIEYDLARYDSRLAGWIGREVAQALEDVLGEVPVAMPAPLPEDDEPVHERVAALARHRPDHPAVIAGRDWVSYAELDHRADLVAAGLRRRGVRQGDVVGLRLPRGIGFIVAVLAAVKAGAAYVPTDPSWPEARIRQVLAHAAFVVDDVDVLVDTDVLPPLDIAADDPFCVLYTSGSAGVPKGALLTHRSVRHLLAAGRVHSPRQEDRVAHLANLAFDLSTWEIWGALLCGATLLIGDRNPMGHQDYAAVLGECSAALLATGLFTELVEHPASRRAIRELRLLLVCGGVLSPGAASRVLRPGALQFNAYGPTESTTFATIGPMAVTTKRHTVPIGTAIEGTRAYVLDEDLNPVAKREIGQLYLAGDGLAVGYLGDPRQSAERFIPDLRVAGQRMYATGDRVRLLADGVLDFVGRTDAQLKVRGFRVEPFEIESRLQAQPGVSAAYSGLDAAGRLVAAVLGTADPAALLDVLRAELPQYLVPYRLVLVDRVPLTARGKVDLARLLSSEDSVVTERSDDQMTRLWSDVLGVVVSADTEFFAAGGDSLTALRLLAACQAEFGIEMRPGDLFDHPTPQEFAALLADRKKR